MARTSTSVVAHDSLFHLKSIWWSFIRNREYVVLYRLFLHFSSFFSVCAGNDTLVTFDDLPSTSSLVPNGYHNINWGNGDYINRYTFGNASGYYTATVREVHILRDPAQHHVEFKYMTCQSYD
jgi:hypothetical protein